MFVSRVLARVSRAIPRTAVSMAAQPGHRFPIVSNQSPPLIQVSMLHHSTPTSSISQLFGFSSSASPESSESAGNGGSEKSNTKVSDSGNTKVADETNDSGSIPESQSTNVRRQRNLRGGTKRTAFSDSDSDEDLSTEDLVKLLTEREELLKQKHEEVAKMQDKVLRTYAEMENVMDRTRREAENTKKFSIQNFAKSLLDVADNLGRAAAVTKTGFAKIDQSKDSAGTLPLLKTLLEGVEMTEKQLSEVFKKYGIEKYDPTNEPFDPHRHHALFQVSDPSKPPGTVAQVLKPGYVLHDRVIRPADVGVTQEAENNGTEEDSGN
ncbi:grpE protein homolog 2, mitochondrial-like isoform X2 [Argentina anserina]|uniref:grpE protein homolog 2, mitochondrial-like isoform X2 n=1 Tax=Argentina anserina TaxID=57926 RepID=UPI0021762E66|nr:grpE protein homolog 2, mitochondrial-like isoform X2 [Potentilla anserina]